MKHHKFDGAYTAIVTPFKGGRRRIDEPAFECLIEAQIKARVDGIVVAGTTGESATLTFDEHNHLVELAVKLVNGRIKVIAGTGANATPEAIDLTRAAEAAGADASLQVAPYYNKPSQEGLFQHFRDVALATKLPILLYSIPGRCGVEIAVDTVKRLAAACPNIVGIKEAGGNVDRVSQLRAALGHKFTILCGDDSLTLPFMSVGAKGVISVVSNIVPRGVAHMVHAYLMSSVGLKYHSLALKLHEKLYPLSKALFIETNPGPVKAALAMMGLIKEEYRLPLVKMEKKNRRKLKGVLEECGLLTAIPVGRKRNGRQARVNDLT